MIDYLYHSTEDNNVNRAVPESRIS